MTDANKTDATTKMAPKDINQDSLAKEDQQRTDDSMLDMMQGRLSFFGSLTSGR